MSNLDRLIERLRSQDAAALARAISLTEASPSLSSQIHEKLRDLTGQATVIGMTGVPGVGKSTLINCLIGAWRQRCQRVAVIAVDPSSPLTGGAVLGDRTRMGEHGEDSGVFIRSVASRGHLGGLSADILCVIDLIDAAGWDVILLETVGTGQSETEISQVADINIVVNAPGLGDEVQMIKAGILEIADVLVINKADHPLTSRTERQLNAMLQLRDNEKSRVPVVKTVATEKQGIGELIEVVDQVSVDNIGLDRQSRFEQRNRRLSAEKMAQRVRSLILEGADLDLVKETLVRLDQKILKD